MRNTATIFPAIHRFFGGWIEQLRHIRTGDEYATILSEVESDSESSREFFPILEDHLSLASDACSNFLELLKEKERLPAQIADANVTILNKLSEIRAVVGLSKFGFRNIRFSGTPDFMAVRQEDSAAIEVTRLGRSHGRRSDVWDWEGGAENLETLDEVGYRAGLMSTGGKVEGALSEAIYREIEEKYRQVRSADATLRIIWISLGRDYLTCGLYELEGIGSFAKMPRTSAKTVALAVQSHRESGLCQQLTHVALCPGRNLDDLLVNLRSE